MEINNDPTKIVLSREMFDNLIKLGGYSDWDNEDEIEAVKRHVRSRNSAYKAEFQEARDKQAKEIRERRWSIQSFLRKWKGKEVFLSDQQGSYAPVTVLRSSTRYRTSVLIQHPFTGKRSVNPADITTEIPAGYRQMNVPGMSRDRWLVPITEDDVQHAGFKLADLNKICRVPPER